MAGILLLVPPLIPMGCEHAAQLEGQLWYQQLLICWSSAWWASSALPTPYEFAERAE